MTWKRAYLCRCRVFLVVFFVTYGTLRADLTDKVGSWFLCVSDFLYATVTGRLVGRFGVGVGYKVGYFFGGVAETFATKHRVSHAVGGKPCAFLTRLCPTYPFHYITFAFFCKRIEVFI